MCLPSPSPCQQGHFLVLPSTFLSQAPTLWAWKVTVFVRPPALVSQDLTHECQGTPPASPHWRGPLPGTTSGLREQVLFSISQVWEILLAFPLLASLLMILEQGSLPKTPRIPPALGPLPVAFRQEYCLPQPPNARAMERQLPAMPPPLSPARHHSPVRAGTPPLSQT